MEKPRRNVGYLIDCSQECRLVCIRWFVKTADLSHELERSGSNLFRSDWRIEIEKGFDIPAHLLFPQTFKIPKGKESSVLLKDFILNLMTSLVMGGAVRKFFTGDGFDKG
jgi:hypothetical protein